jgi:hypothetical protein
MRCAAVFAIMGDMNEENRNRIPLVPRTREEGKDRGGIPLVPRTREEGKDRGGIPLVPRTREEGKDRGGIPLVPRTREEGKDRSGIPLVPRETEPDGASGSPARNHHLLARVEIDAVRTVQVKVAVK